MILLLPNPSYLIRDIPALTREGEPSSGCLLGAPLVRVGWLGRYLALTMKRNPYHVSQHRHAVDPSGTGCKAAFARYADPLRALAEADPRDYSPPGF